MNLNQSDHLPYGVWHEAVKEPLPVPPKKEEISFLRCAIRYYDNSLGYGIYQYDLYSEIIQGCGFIQIAQLTGQ